MDARKAYLRDPIGQTLIIPHLPFFPHPPSQHHQKLLLKIISTTTTSSSDVQRSFSILVLYDSMSHSFFLKTSPPTTNINTITTNNTYQTHTLTSLHNNFNSFLYNPASSSPRLQQFISCDTLNLFYNQILHVPIRPSLLQPDKAIRLLPSTLITKYRTPIFRITPSNQPKILHLLSIIVNSKFPIVTRLLSPISNCIPLLMFMFFSGLNGAIKEKSFRTTNNNEAPTPIIGRH